MGQNLVSVAIPPTTLRRYISYNKALNLRLPGEDTGDWHFLPSFFQTKDSLPKQVPLAGEGEAVDTTPSLGTFGIRDMAAVLDRYDIRPNTGPVYVADHYRGITDIAVREVQDGRYPMSVTAETVNQWLDTEVQIRTLRDDYLRGDVRHHAEAVARYKAEVVQRASLTDVTA